MRSPPACAMRHRVEVAMNPATVRRLLPLLLASAVLLLVGACTLVGGRGPRSGGQTSSATPVRPAIPPDIAAIPDAVPRSEPRSRNGNPPVYEVLGRRYTLLATADGYVERGVASWYGPGFHGVSTSTGEPYDMYAMTAAHKTLPIPCYARITNLVNGRTVVVRINDRGPFVANRLIDLSYTAAAKLDMLRAGTAMVEVRVVTPDAPQNEAPRVVPVPPALYVQAGAFAVPANAQRLLLRLQQAGLSNAFVLPPLPGRRLYRVRVGPVSSVDDYDVMAARLATLGVPDARLALD